MPFGPGFYIPPPGYQASSLGVPYHLRVDAAGPSKTAYKMESVGKSPMYRMRDEKVVKDAMLTCYDAPVVTLPQWQGEASPSITAPTIQPKSRSRTVSTRTRTAHSCPSLIGTLALWAVLATLVAITQTMLLTFYDRQQSTATCTALSYAVLCFVLYGAFSSIVGISIETFGRDPIHYTDPQATPAFKRQASVLCSLTDSFVSSSGVVTCLGAGLQLVGLVVYAIGAAERSVKYSVIVALSLAVMSTLALVLHGLNADGHLCSPNHHRPSSTLPTRESGEPTLPIARKSTSSSQSSSVSSHAGFHVPDYNLDSDTDSSDDNPRARRPKADWTDKVLQGLIRSPLLDGQRALR